MSRDFDSLPTLRSGPSAPALSGILLATLLVIGFSPRVRAAEEPEAEETQSAPSEAEEAEEAETEEQPAGTAEAEKPGVVEPQSHLLSANPDTPGVTFVWRGQLRGTLGVRVPIVGKPQQPRFSMAIVPLIELYNQTGSSVLLPNEGWRGQLGIQAGWLWGELPTGRRYVLGGLVRHESDHATDRADAPGAALQFNEVTIIGAVQLPQPRMMVRVEARARALVSSCTDIETVCSGLKGNASFGAEADLMLDAGGAEPIRKRWYFFSSVHAGAVVPHRQVIRELRTTLHVGVFVPVKFGVWQLFALGFFGNDIGIYRGNVVYQGGAGVRWTY